MTRLKQLRLERGLKQNYVAEKVFISPQYLSAIENSREKPTQEILLLLAKFYGVSAYSLLEIV